jgi:hypothetical protein
MNNPLKSAVFAGLLIFSKVAPSSVAPSSLATALQGPQESASAAALSTGMENGSILYAELIKTLDAKKAKVGDPVAAQLLADVVAHGKIVVRRDSKLLGHVTEVQARSKESPESRLGIVFDRVIVKGQEVPFRSTLIALRPAPRLVIDAPSAPSPPGMNPAAGPPPERHYPVPKGPTPKMNSTMGTTVKARDQDVADMATTDIEGLSLDSGSNGGGQSVVSLKHTVKLESGVRIELRVTGAGQ